MTRLSIDLPDDVRANLEDRATRAGYPNVEAYIESVLRDEAAEAGNDPGAPPHLTFSSDDELEAILVRRLDDPADPVEATAEFWTDLKRRASERRSKGQ